MSALHMILDAIEQIEAAAGCMCFLASECDPKRSAKQIAMYARLYWEEPKPSAGEIWANGQGWAILPAEHNRNRSALMDVLDRLPRKEIYTFINGIERQIADEGRVEFCAIVDVLYIRVSWRDLQTFCWEYGIGKDHFDKISIEHLIERVNTSRLQEAKP